VGTVKASDYDALWDEIAGCVRCVVDPRIGAQIRQRWESVDTPFLPYPGYGADPATGQVRYILLGMEPSERPKAKKTRAYMRRKIAEGGRNFAGDAHIRWAARTWLLEGGEAFIMTDLAKCMLPVKDADGTRARRYANCAPWLGREINVFKGTLRAVIPMGAKAHEWCLAFAQESWPVITKPIVHPAYRFKWSDDGATDYTGLPGDAEYAQFARSCGAKKTRLDKRTRNLIARWHFQFDQIKTDLDRARA
jgi:hypothetical protein